MGNHVKIANELNLLTPLKKGKMYSILDFKTPCNTEFELGHTIYSYYSIPWHILGFLDDNLVHSSLQAFLLIIIVKSRPQRDSKD